MCSERPGHPGIAECILCYEGLSMRESSLTWRSDLYGILPHPSEPWLLMLPTAAGWSLPHMCTR